MVLELYFHFCFFETGSCYASPAGFELMILLLSLPSAVITHMHHHTWLQIVFFLITQSCQC
jgi:hypothetical protein